MKKLFIDSLCLIILINFTFLKSNDTNKYEYILLDFSNIYNREKCLYTLTERFSDKIQFCASQINFNIIKWICNKDLRIKTCLTMTNFMEALIENKEKMKSFGDFLKEISNEEQITILKSLIEWPNNFFPYFLSNENILVIFIENMHNIISIKTSAATIDFFTTFYTNKQLDEQLVNILNKLCLFFRKNMETLHQITNKDLIVDEIIDKLSKLHKTLYTLPKSPRQHALKIYPTLQSICDIYTAFASFFLQESALISSNLQIKFLENLSIMFAFIQEINKLLPKKYLQKNELLAETFLIPIFTLLEKNKILMHNEVVFFAKENQLIKHRTIFKNLYNLDPTPEISEKTQEIIISCVQQIFKNFLSNIENEINYNDDLFFCIDLLAGKKLEAYFDKSETIISREKKFLFANFLFKASNISMAEDILTKHSKLSTQLIKQQKLPKYTNTKEALTNREKLFILLFEQAFTFKVSSWYKALTTFILSANKNESLTEAEIDTLLLLLSNDYHKELEKHSPHFILQFIIDNSRWLVKLQNWKQYPIIKKIVSEMSYTVNEKQLKGSELLNSLSQKAQAFLPENIFASKWTYQILNANFKIFSQLMNKIKKNQILQIQGLIKKITKSDIKQIWYSERISSNKIYTNELSKFISRPSQIKFIEQILSSFKQYRIISDRLALLKISKPLWWTKQTTYVRLSNISRYIKQDSKYIKNRQKTFLKERILFYNKRNAKPIKLSGALQFIKKPTR